MGTKRLAILMLVLATGPAAGAEDVALFEAKIRPLLAERCYPCHSEKAARRRGGLLLDSPAGLRTGGDSGPVVAPGRPQESLLLKAVLHEQGAPHMPPKGKLPQRDIALLQEWIRRGASMPQAGAALTARAPALAQGRKFWSFQPLRPVPPPAAVDAAWPRTRIDTFVLAELEKRRLWPSRAASSRTLIRRVYFDLVGLPPTPEEVEAFVHDGRPDAYERLVERLLTSPQHGERWARFWLDLARYCDVAEPWSECKGQPWLYRDWVMRALNEDMPYNAFVQRQLAADLLPQAAAADTAALGFLGLSPTYWKELKLAPDVIKTVVAEEWEERIQAVTGTFLGLTVACARCHDHKFDPITQQDYYALAGVFASTRPADRPYRERGTEPMVPAVQDAGLFVLADGPQRTKVEYRPGVAQDVAVQVRGNAANSGALVPRRFLAVLSADPPPPFRQGSGRLELARALVREGGPLAARVMVNRVWKHHFGAGLVETPSDFGAQGARPSHPELLEDLAARFVAGGWSLKWLHREIVLSATYRQASAHDPARQAVDGENRWLWRMNRRRLEVEAWRDAMLAASGKRSQEVGGPPQDLGDTHNRRRTLYGTVKRRELNELLRLYDFPDPVSHSPARAATTTPLQQLFVLNGPLLRQQAVELVGRLAAEVAGGTEDRVRRAYLLLFGRPATDAQVRQAVEFLTGGPEGQPTQAGWVEYAQALLASNEFLFID
jgi:hypothetical protein